MYKQWYLNWHKRITTSKWQLQVWRFLGINIIYVYLLGGALLLALPHYRALAITGLFAFILAWGVLTKIVRYIVPERRPYQTFQIRPEEGGLFSRIHKSANSFPSGHAASLAALSTVLLAYSPSLGIVSFVVLLFNGFARVVLGYHYWFDVLAGGLLGVVAGILVTFLY